MENTQSPNDGSDLGVHQLAVEDSPREPAAEQVSDRILQLALHPSPSGADDLEDTLESAGGSKVVLDKNLWKELPEGILSNVLKRLPPAAYCRFRCVCRNWKQMLSPSPDWVRSRTLFTVAANEASNGIGVFCHSEEKYFSFPFGAGLAKELNLALHLRYPNFILPHPICWELIDVDGGLFCYQTSVYGGPEICVCNPLTQAVRLITPDFLRTESSIRVKLLVDEESKTFKVVLVSGDDPLTAVYDSVESSWGFEAFFVPDHYFARRNLLPDQFFAWKNLFYAYSADVRQRVDIYLMGLHLTSGQWEVIRMEVPHEQNEIPTRHHLVSDRNEVMLVQTYLGTRPHLSVWKLRDNESSDRLDFSLSMWENLRIEQTRAMQRIVGTLTLVHVCCGPTYICFVFREYMINVTDLCLKYSLVTRTYILMPLVKGWEVLAKMFHWEPSASIEVG